MNNLTKYREEIEKIDKEILEAFSRRFSVVEKVGEWKKQNGITNPLDKARWNELMQKNIAFGKDKGLSEEFVKKIWEMIHLEALEREK